MLRPRTFHHLLSHPTSAADAAPVAVGVLVYYFYPQQAAAATTMPALLCGRFLSPVACFRNILLFPRASHAPTAAAAATTTTRASSNNSRNILFSFFVSFPLRFRFFRAFLFPISYANVVVRGPQPIKFVCSLLDC